MKNDSSSQARSAVMIASPHFRTELTGSFRATCWRERKHSLGKSAERVRNLGRMERDDIQREEALAVGVGDELGGTNRFENDSTCGIGLRAGEIDENQTVTNGISERERNSFQTYLQSGHVTIETLIKAKRAS